MINLESDRNEGGEISNAKAVGNSQRGLRFFIVFGMRWYVVMALCIARGGNRARFDDKYV